MANKLPLKTRALILNMLCEGQSMRATARLADVSFNTVAKLLIDAGKVCADLHDELVQGVTASRVQCDEVWSFTYAKQKNVPHAKAAPAEAGDTWTWTALDGDSKLIVSGWSVAATASTRSPSWTTCGAGWPTASNSPRTGTRPTWRLSRVPSAAMSDYAMLVKLYGEAPEAEKRYSPATCIGTRKRRIEGSPDPNAVSTSYDGRTSPCGCRCAASRASPMRSPRSSSHMHMVALYTLWYNFIRIHKTLRVTPAMAAGLSETVWDMDDVVRIMDERAPKPGSAVPTASVRFQTDALPRCASARAEPSRLLPLGASPRQPTASSYPAPCPLYLVPSGSRAILHSGVAGSSLGGATAR